MADRFAPHSRPLLEEAVRDIQQMAGLTYSRSSQSGNGVRPPSITIGITSPNVREGKTTLAMALASSLARDFNDNVMLIDADFKTHSIESEYGLGGTEGLAEILSGAVRADQVAHRVPEASLSIVTAGAMVEDAARMARSELATTRFEEMKTENRFVIMDLPATLPSATSPMLATHCDSVIVVVRARRTTQEDLRRTLLKLNAANVVGVVINRWSTRVPGWIERSLGLSR